MPAEKHLLNDISGEDAPASKLAKTSANDDWRDLFEIKVKIPSLTKTFENDWKPPTRAQLKMRARFHGRPMSPLTDQEKAEIYGPRESRPPWMMGLEQITTPRENDSPRMNVTGAKDEGGDETRDENSDEESDEDMDEHLDEDMDEESDNESDTDPYEGMEWIEVINGSVLSKKTNINGKHDCIGSCTSVLIRRNQIRSNFHDDIKDPTEETSAMGFDLFDRYGRLKPVFKKDPVRSGSGIWGDELDHGDILLIDQVSINECHRRQGLGREMVRDILQKAMAKCDPQTFVAIARSAALNSEVRDECENKSDEEQRHIYDREERTAECFLRSLGFRRIGYTEWFAFLPGNTQHACHSLPADKDFDPPRPTPAHTTNIFFETLLDEFEATKGDTARLAVIQKALESYGPEEDIWVLADRRGNTLLHHAAAFENPSCVKWILEKCPRLITIRNYMGGTPLELCQEQIDDTRTQHAISDKFTGCSQPFLDILSTLKGLSDPSPEELQRLRYGCTCGQCQEGFMSPRMHLALRYCAADAGDMLSDDADNSDGDYFVEKNRLTLKYLQPGVRDNLRTNKSMRQGFASILGHFARLLRDHTEPPHVHKILEMTRSSREWPPVTKTYLSRGGTVEAVGSALFARAMDESLWAGGGIIWDLYADEMEALSACRNDDEFGFVSGLCGYKRVRRVQYVSMTGIPLDDDF
ncbi:hypothetical protein TrVFT333_003790 [Trichoderma virens FT-333]|nr:hypothetical protein TrVFT333_003790 [Trichoderma virens FT-333]